MMSKNRLVLIVLLVALLIRIVTVIVTGQQNTTHADAASYNSYAVAVLNQKDWMTNPDFYDASRPPFYPLFIAAIYAIFGINNYTALYIFQAFVSVLTCLYIYKFGVEVFDNRIATLALIWSSFYIYYLQYIGAIMRETLVFFFLLVFFYYLYLHLKAARSISSSFWLSSISYSILIHIDPRYLFYLPFLIILFVIFQSVKRGTRNYLIFVALAILLLIPWTIRNYIAYGGFVLINTRTFDLRGSHEKNPRMDDFLKYNVLSFGNITWTFNKNYPTEEERELIKQGLNPNNRPQQEIDAIRNDVYPASTFLQRKWFQLKEFWRAWRFKSEYRPFPDNRFVYWSLKHNAISILFYGLLLPFMFYGIVDLFIRKKKLVWFLVFPLCIQTLLHVLQWAKTRYRNPIDVFIIILACYGLWRVYRTFKGGKSNIVQSV